MKNWFKKKEYQAIRIDKTYDTVEQLPAYKVATKEEIETIISHVRANKQLYQENIKKQDQLNNYPDISTEEITEEYPENTSIPVKYRIHYTYTTEIPDYKIELFPNFWRALKYLSAAFVAVCILSIFILQHQHEQNMIQDTCYMYLKNGIPQTMELGNSVYHLNSDGSIEDIDALFLNPYDREILQQYNNCIKVNVK